MVNKNLAFSTNVNRLIKKYGKVLLKVQYEVINPNIKMFFVSRVEVTALVVRQKNYYTAIRAENLYPVMIHSISIRFYCY